MHKLAYVLENETHKLQWDFEIQTDHLISARPPNLNQSPTCLARLTWMFDQIGVKWTYSCYFVGCGFQDLIKSVRSILTQFSFRFFSEYFVKVQVVQPYSNTDMLPVVQWLSSQEMETTTRVQILDQANCISHSTNTLGKGMNPIIFPPAMGKQQGRLGSTALVRQLIQEKENSELKPVKLRLKIDLVSYPARAEGLGKYAHRNTDMVITLKNIYLSLKSSIFNGDFFQGSENSLAPTSKISCWGPIFQ